MQSKASTTYLQVFTQRGLSEALLTSLDRSLGPHIFITSTDGDGPGRMHWVSAGIFPEAADIHVLGLEREYKHHATALAGDAPDYLSNTLYLRLL